jgi:methylphosphotriester-DNA--protein-cysteine methyltransferase
LNRVQTRPELETGRERPAKARPVARRKNRTSENHQVIAPPPEQAAAYVANINSDIFHLHDCKWTKRIKPGNMIEFNGIEDALKKGFNPCRYCRPRQAGQVRPAYRPGVARKIAGYR